VRFLCVFVVVAAALFGWHQFHRPITYAPGVLIPAEPEQTGTSDGPVRRGDFHLKPLAHFSIDGRVLHRENYHFDRQAALVPVDLALGWGPMSDQRVLDQLKITQSMRFYWFEYKMPPPIAKEEIISHSTNLHVIPENAGVASVCRSLRTGALVRLSGDLVEATRSDGGVWRSSLSRTDTGNGACELMLVKEVTMLSIDPAQDRRALAKK
jgi:hypothetical protein